MTGLSTADRAMAPSGAEQAGGVAGRPHKSKATPPAGRAGP
ncbi:hypothetical protein AB0D66_24170 [Streptomyces sp. NPDC048270]